MTNSSESTSVVIAGGGPVGMTLALELARHGIASTLVERNESTTQHPKMDLTNGRGMELFRRLGMADEARAVGVPEDQDLDLNRINKEEITIGDLQKIVKTALTSSEKTILVVIYNNQNQRRYIGVKLD